jgi:DNA-binding response OmpR family regulator
VKLKKVLLMNKDPITGGFIRSKLEEQDYVVALSNDYGNTIALSEQWNPNLVILDASAADPDSYAACRKMRETSDIPIIVLSARDEELDKALFFNLGVDDYVTKPFSLEVLIARIKAVLRRTNSGSNKPEANKTLLEPQTPYVMAKKVPELI